MSMAYPHSYFSPDVASTRQPEITRLVQKNPLTENPVFSQSTTPGLEPRPREKPQLRNQFRKRCGSRHPRIGLNTQPNPTINMPISCDTEGDTQ